LSQRSENDTALDVGRDAVEKIEVFQARNAREKFQVLRASLKSRDTIRVPHAHQVLIRELSDELAGAQSTSSEAGSLLSCAYEHAELPVQVRRDLDGKHGPKSAVVTTPVGNSVHVGATSDYGTVLMWWQTPEVPEPVQPGQKTSLLQPLRDEQHRTRFLRGVGKSGGTTAFVRG
jgi:hypothetical protein